MPRNPEFRLHGATIRTGRSGTILKIADAGWAEYLPAISLATRGGSISFWIKPLWKETDRRSKTFLSLPWADGRHGYLVLSQGWWEPTGAGRLYFVASNQDFVHCSVPYRLVAGFWTHFAVTWENGAHGNCRVYIDGEKVAEYARPFTGSYPAAGPLIIGSDHGTTEKKGRGAEALIGDLCVASRPLADDEVHAGFLRRRNDFEPFDGKNEKWLLDGMTLPLKETRNREGTLVETRAIFDEDILWATSRRATDVILSRIKRAGFNVYVPCVWHGKTAYYASRVAAADLQVRRRTDAGDDPLSYLIQRAHSLGIEVHPWFTVVFRDTDAFRGYYGDGTPEHAFDIHNAAFRSFIKDLMLDVVRRYDVDGVNLDYIRAMGLCTSDSCRADYEKRSGYPFWPDYALRGIVGASRDRLQSWQDRAVTDIAAGFAQAARKLKPELVISVDGHPKPKGAVRPLEGRDEVSWANQGWIDIVFSMDYRERVDYETIDKVRADLKSPDRLIVSFGNYDKRDHRVVRRSGERVNRYMEFARRKWPGSGAALYLYGQLSDEQVEALARGAFTQPSIPAWRGAGKPGSRS